MAVSRVLQTVLSQSERMMRSVYSSRVFIGWEFGMGKFLSHT